MGGPLRRLTFEWSDSNIGPSKCTGAGQRGYREHELSSARAYLLKLMRQHFFCACRFNSKAIYEISEPEDSFHALIIKKDISWHVTKSNLPLSHPHPPRERGKGKTEEARKCGK